MSPKSLVAVLILALVGPAEAWAQSSPDLTPPPMVPAGPPPPPAPEPGTAPAVIAPAASSTHPGTPPPPAGSPPAYVPGSQPSSSGYRYSPYGSPMGQEKPAPEIGLMVSESLFGMLTAAASLVLPYVILSALAVQLTGVATFDAPFGNVMLIALMVAAPMATAQTQVGIANGSAYYQIESWVPLLAGLLGDTLVFLTYSAWNNASFPNSGFFNAPPALFGSLRQPDPIIYLLIAASVGVPLLQMAAINLFKQPKHRPLAERADRRPPAVALQAPTPMPVFSQTSTGLSVGFGVSFLRGTF